MRQVTKIKDEDETEITYAIHEVHYGVDGEVTGWTKEPASLVSDTPDFGWHLEQINVACKKPTLDFETGKELGS